MIKKTKGDRREEEKKRRIPFTYLLQITRTSVLHDLIQLCMELFLVVFRKQQ